MLASRLPVESHCGLLFGFQFPAVLYYQSNISRSLGSCTTLLRIAARPGSGNGVVYLGGGSLVEFWRGRVWIRTIGSPKLTFLLSSSHSRIRHEGRATSSPRYTVSFEIYIHRSFNPAVDVECAQSSRSNRLHSQVDSVRKWR